MTDASLHAPELWLPSTEGFSVLFGYSGALCCLARKRPSLLSPRACAVLGIVRLHLHLRPHQLPVEAIGLQNVSMYRMRLLSRDIKCHAVSWQLSRAGGYEDVTMTYRNNDGVMGYCEYSWGFRECRSAFIISRRPFMTVHDAVIELPGGPFMVCRDLPIRIVFY